jgi:ParB family chromosome partitioning protein
LAPRKTAEQAAPDRPAHDAVFALRASFTSFKVCLRHAVALAARRWPVDHLGAVTPREDTLPATALAQAVGLDMHRWWTPTAEGYFAHVSKAKAIEAVQAFAPEHAARLAKLKKNDLASEAERLAVGTGWLPAMLRAVEPEAREEVAPVADSGE